MAKRTTKANHLSDLDMMDEELEKELDEMNDQGDEDLEEMSLKELKAYAKENGIKIKGMVKMDEDELREAIQEAIDEDEGEDEEPELEDMSLKELKAFAKKKGFKIKGMAKMDEDELRDEITDALDEENEGSEDDEDLEEMSLKELKDYAKENDIKIKGMAKMDEDELREAIQEAMDPDAELDNEDEDPDLDEDLEDMSKKELKAYAKENDIKIKGMAKMDEDELRDAIQEYIDNQEDEDEGDGEYEPVDLADYDKDELLEFAKEQGIKIKGAKSMTEKKLRHAIKDTMDEEEDNGGDDDDDLDDLKTKKEFKAYARKHGIKPPSGMKVADLKAYIKKELKGGKKGGKSSAGKPSRSPKSSGPLLKKGEVNKILKKAEKIETLAGEFDGILESDEPVTKAAVLRKAAKKAESLTAVAAEIDDLLSEALKSVE